MGASYVPEIFVPSEKRILSPSFHSSYFVPPSGFLPATALIRKTPVCNLRHIPVWHRIRFMRSFAMCRLLFWGALHRIEKQPAHLDLLNWRFRRPLGGRDGVENPTFGHNACFGYKHPT